MTLSDQKSNRRHNMNLIGSEWNFKSPVSCLADSRSVAQTTDRILQVSDGELTDLGRCGE